MGGQLGAPRGDNWGVLALLSLLFSSCLQGRLLFSFLFQENLFGLSVVFEQIIKRFTPTWDFPPQRQGMGLKIKNINKIIEFFNLKKKFKVSSLKGNSCKMYTKQPDNKDRKKRHNTYPLQKVYPITRLNGNSKTIHQIYVSACNFKKNCFTSSKTLGKIPDMTYGIEIQQYIQTTWVPGVLCCHSMTSIPVEFIWQILHVSLRAIGQNWAHHRTCRREYIWGGGPEACPFSSP